MVAAVAGLAGAALLLWALANWRGASDRSAALTTSVITKATATLLARVIASAFPSRSLGSRTPERDRLALTIRGGAVLLGAAAARFPELRASRTQLIVTGY